MIWCRFFAPNARASNQFIRCILNPHVMCHSIHNVNVDLMMNETKIKICEQFICDLNERQ